MVVRVVLSVPYLVTVLLEGVLPYTIDLAISIVLLVA